MHRFETIDLGTHGGGEYILVGFVEPEPTPGEPFDPASDAVEYGVALARIRAHKTNIEVLRLDTAHAEKPHITLGFIPPDEEFERRQELDDHWGYGNMKRFVLAHWVDFADGYIYYNKEVTALP